MCAEALLPRAKKLGHRRVTSEQKPTTDSCKSKILFNQAIYSRGYMEKDLVKSETYLVLLKLTRYGQRVVARATAQRVGC